MKEIIYEVFHIGIHTSWNDAVKIADYCETFAAEQFAEIYDDGNYGLVDGEYIMVKVRVFGEENEGTTYKVDGEMNPIYYAKEVE